MNDQFQPLWSISIILRKLETASENDDPESYCQLKKDQLRKNIFFIATFLTNYNKVQSKNHSDFFYRFYFQKHFFSNVLTAKYLKQGFLTELVTNRSNEWFLKNCKL